MKQRRVNRILKLIALGCAVAAIAAPIAQARPAFQNEGVVATPTSAPVVHSSLAGPAGTISTSSSGFDWGDAGIGAGIAVGLTLLVLGGVAVAMATRGRKPRVSV